MRENTPLDTILTAKLFGGGGGSVTPASIVTATGQMTSEQKSQTRANLGTTDASTSIPDNVKQALLACFADVAWVDDQGQAHYDALEAALYPLDHITAVYTQSGTVYDTDSLDSLKADLVVTAVYEGGNTATVAAANYTLSGTLTVGTSTITVSYGGKTTTFDVTVATHFLYKLENRSFSNEVIATELALMDEDRDFTIALDMSLTTLPTSGNASAPRYCSLVNASGGNFNIALTGTSAQLLFANFMGNGANEDFGSYTTGRFRAVLTHIRNSGSVFFAVRSGSGSKLTKTVTGTFAASTKALRFGFGTSTNMLPTGTMNKAYVYDYAMTDAEVNTFLGL